MRFLNKRIAGENKRIAGEIGKVSRRDSSGWGPPLNASSRKTEKE
jgi:hypothetical protein